jgi:HPt (histidine-containing phosphotransfer) domain-containing protein
MNVFDREAALENVGGDEELLAELVSIFIQEAPLLVDAIRAGIASGDSDQVQDAAHSVKGAISQFAAQLAYDAAYQLEQSAASGDLSGTTEGLAHLEGEIARLCQMLRNEQR